MPKFFVSEATPPLIRFWLRLSWLPPWLLRQSYHGSGAGWGIVAKLYELGAAESTRSGAGAAGAESPPALVLVPLAPQRELCQPINRTPNRPEPTARGTDAVGFCASGPTGARTDGGAMLYLTRAERIQMDLVHHVFESGWVGPFDRERLAEAGSAPDWLEACAVAGSEAAEGREWISLGSPVGSLCRWQGWTAMAALERAA